jgi:hypothetical protein
MAQKNPVFTLIILEMRFANTTLALALVAINTNLFAEACDGHGRDHHHHHSNNDNGNDNDLGCDEDSANGLSYEIDGRRIQRQFRVGDYNWGTLEAFQAAGARCVSSEPSPRQVQDYNDILDDYRTRFGFNRRLAAAKQIPVYFHVIKPSNGIGGDVSDAQIREQIAVLNASLEGLFEFTFAGKDSTLRDSYYEASFGSGAEVQMKSSLRKGGVNALNIYTTAPYVSNEAQHVWVHTFSHPHSILVAPFLSFVKHSKNGVLGWATLPDGVKSSVGTLNSYDGIVIRYDTLPFGSLVPYNEGDTAVHEVGHWLGLFHTFQGGCGDDAVLDGDRILDTPAEASPAFGCPDNRDVSNLNSI